MAQHASDTNHIFQKIDSQIIISPSKSRDMIFFAKKNDKNNKTVNHCDLLLVQSYYYENNFNDALQLIIQTADNQNLEAVILYRSILYSLGIKEVEFTIAYRQNALYKINEEILTISELISKNDRNRAFNKFVAIFSEISIDNKSHYRESLSFLFSNLILSNWIVEYPEFRKPALRILELYSNDIEFAILKKGLFPEEVSDEWIDKTTKAISTTTNFRLKVTFYNLLQNYYLEKKNTSKYISTTDKIDKYILENTEDVKNARSQWLYLTETKTINRYDYVRKRGSIILTVIFFIFFSMIVAFINKIKQKKLKGREYQQLINRLKAGPRKKKESQVISESVKLNLLEKLEKLELTYFYLDSKISIQTLAKKLDSNSKYVSDIINTYKKKNFTSYINEMRISYIKQKLKNENIYRSYKIKYLAEECGFSSHSVFSSVFKNIEGISPAQYIQLLNNI
nr:helix-turn-helix domain-containing protein [uncultured Chryseobacterium sp.]